MSKGISSYLSIWKRQVKNWRVVSIRALFSRFFQRLTTAYTNIYIRELGANPIQLGMVNSFNQVARAVISAPIGWLQDRYSLRKIFLIGVGLVQVVTLMYALATSWIMIIPAMILSAFTARMGLCVTLCDVALKDEDRGTCKGICDGLFLAPAALAPTIAAFIITYFGGISVRSIKPLYWIQLAGGVILLFFLVVQLKEIARPKATSKISLWGGYREVFKRGNALKRFIAFFVVNTIITNIITPFRMPFVNEIKNATPYIIGLMSTAQIIIQIVFSAPMGRIADKIGGKRMIYITEPLFWASSLLLVFAPSPAFLILSSVLGGFRQIAQFVGITPLIVGRVPIDCIGRWRGLLNLFGGLISIPAPIIGGIIWETINPQFLMLIPIAVSLLVKIPILTTIPGKRNVMHVQKLNSVKKPTE